MSIASGILPLFARNALLLIFFFLLLCFDVIDDTEGDNRQDDHTDHDFPYRLLQIGNHVSHIWDRKDCFSDKVVPRGAEPVRNVIRISFGFDCTVFHGNRSVGDVVTRGNLESNDIAFLNAVEGCRCIYKTHTSRTDCRLHGAGTGDIRTHAHGEQDKVGDNRSNQQENRCIDKQFLHKLVLLG